MKKRNDRTLIGIFGVVGICAVVTGILAFLNLTDPDPVADLESISETETIEVAVQDIVPEIPKSMERPAEVKVPELKTEGVEAVVSAKDEERPIQEIPEKGKVPEDTVVTRPAQDDSHPGQIYVEGFGWIQRGGENKTIYAEDMYENGNKIGDM